MGVQSQLVTITIIMIIKARILCAQLAKPGRKKQYLDIPKNKNKKNKEMKISS